MSNPKQVKGIVPAKNGDMIGLADQESKKFYKLDYSFISVWLLCDGKKSEEEISKEFAKTLKESAKKGADVKINGKKLDSDVKIIINKLRKYCLVE